MNYYIFIKFIIIKLTINEINIKIIYVILYSLLDIFNIDMYLDANSPNCNI
jgi:hypothetical protein